MRDAYRDTYSSTFEFHRCQLGPPITKTTQRHTFGSFVVKDNKIVSCDNNTDSIHLYSFALPEMQRFKKKHSSASRAGALTHKHAHVHV